MREDGGGIRAPFNDAFTRPPRGSLQTQEGKANCAASCARSNCASVKTAPKHRRMVFSSSSSCFCGDRFQEWATARKWQPPALPSYELSARTRHVWALRSARPPQTHTTSIGVSSRWTSSASVLPAPEYMVPWTSRVRGVWQRKPLGGAWWQTEISSSATHRRRAPVIAHTYTNDRGRTLQAHTQ
jgi:hypothetical protein